MTEYKETVLEMFHVLTECEIKASLDTAKDKPDFIAMADIYIMAVKRCRQLLEVILQGTRNE
jgi:hypothetical protein